MKPQFCIEPAASAHGDCYRACIASILGVAAREVPNFAVAGDWDQMFVAARQWLQGRGLGLFRTWCSAGWEKEKVLECFSRDNPAVPVILIGHSGKPGSRDNHAVVAMDGRIVHDPGRVGIDGPCLNSKDELGWWYLDIIAFADFSTNLQPERPRP